MRLFRRPRLMRRAGMKPRPEAAALTTPAWLVHEEQLAHTSFLAMARRLPRHLRAAGGLAWAASPTTTILAVTLMLLSGTLTALGLLAAQQVVQALLAAGPSAHRVGDTLPSLLFVGITLALRSALTAAGDLARSRLTPKVTAAAETRFVELATLVELSAFDDAGFADEMERARERGADAASGLVERTVELMTGLVGVVAVTAALVVIHPLLAPLLGLTAVPVAWGAVRAARLQYVSLHRRVARRRRLWLLQSLMTDRHTAAEIRSHQMRGYLLEQHSRVLRAETAADLDLAAHQATSRTAGAALSGLATAIVYTVTAVLLAQGRVPLDAATAAVVALQTGRQALHVMVQAVNGVYEEALYFADFTDFTKRAAARVPSTADRRTSDPFFVLELRDVSLRYAGEAHPALTGVSLQIRRGETIALVGENGSGKTTLARVITTLYPPTTGDVQWDGRSIVGLSPEPFRRHIAVIGQDYWHWPISARDNIRVGDADRLDPDDIATRAAAKAAGVHDTIVNLSHGYDTLLDRSFSDGHELSGGQWQRLAVARALFRDAPLLVCDEPSAALDPRAEHELFQRLRRRGDDLTTVRISHRLANVRHVDRIVVLHRGRLVETVPSGIATDATTAVARPVVAFYLRGPTPRGAGSGAM